MSNNPQKGSIDYLEFPSQSSEDLSKAKSFYSAVFGWSYKDWGGNYADTKDSLVSHGLNSDPTHRTAHPIAVIHVPEIEKARDEIISAGGKITREIFAFPGGRRFHFTDPAGNELGVWSE